MAEIPLHDHLHGEPGFCHSLLRLNSIAARCRLRIFMLPVLTAHSIVYTIAYSAPQQVAIVAMYR